MADFEIHQYDVVVEYGDNADNAYFKNIGLIEISTSQTEEEQYFTLLHEASHVVVMQKKDFTYLGESGIILNEALAWAEAEDLIQNLSLPLDQKRWQRFKDRSIASYIERKR